MSTEHLRALIKYHHDKMKSSGAMVERKSTIRFVQSAESSDSRERTLWRAKAIVDLYEWMQASKDYRKTVELWAAVYIRCGSCLRGWQDWCAENPIGDDLPAWIEAATRIVTEKRWI